MGDTVVRQNGAKTTTKALADGQPVFVGGPVVSGSKDARLIVIRPASAGSGSPSPSSGSWFQLGHWRARYVGELAGRPCRGAARGGGRAAARGTTSMLLSMLDHET